MDALRDNVKQQQQQQQQRNHLISVHYTLSLAQNKAAHINSFSKEQEQKILE